MSKVKSVGVAIVALVAMTTVAVADSSKPNQKTIALQYDLTQRNKSLVLKAYQELFGDHDLTALAVRQAHGLLRLGR